MTRPPSLGTHDALAGLGCLVALIVMGRNLPDESDDVLARVLGPDLNAATMRIVAYVLIAAAIVGVIVVLAT